MAKRKTSPPPIPDPAARRQQAAAAAYMAMSLPNSEDQRRALRIIVDNEGIAQPPAAMVRDACNRSKCLPGAVRPTLKGIRDYLSVVVLLGLATGVIGWADVLDAIRDPAKNGVPDTSAPHGFMFGRPKSFSVSDARDAAKRARMGLGVTRAAVAALSHAKTEAQTKVMWDMAAAHLAGGDTRALVNFLNEFAMEGTSMPKGTSLDYTGVTLVAAMAALNSAYSSNKDVAALSVEEATNHMAAFLFSKSGDASHKTYATPLAALIAASDGPPKFGDMIAIDDPTAEIVREFGEFVAAVSADVERTDSTEAKVAAGVAEESDLPPAFTMPDAKMVGMLDAVLSSAGMPSLEEIAKRDAELRRVASDAMKANEGLREIARKAKAMAAITPKVEGEATPTGKIGEVPEGKVVTKTAADVFGIKGAAATAFSFEVPVFEWAFPHPDVPEIDESYVFRPDSLVSLLFALVKNQRPWVHGHTGTGKSTLVEQVAARLHWPVKRVNFDSEITRMDLVGRDTLTTDPKGSTITKWVDGILPQALRGPYILLLDEIDFVRPDVAYVMQRITEGKGLMLNENGGEWVKPHAMSRICATANTVGQGDEHGMYQGARPQSLAFLDRFFPFIEVPYLSEAQEKDLIMKRVPDIDAKAASQVAKYVTEHRQAFTNAQIMQPLSPRGIGAVADAYVSFLEVYRDPKKAMQKALKDMVHAKASSTDGAVIKGLIDKVLK